MDHIDKELLGYLQENARVSMTELGKLVGLTSPAATERVRKLEERGVITGYRAIIDAEKLNKQVTAYILVEPANCQKFAAFSLQYADVVESHRIAGQYSYLTKVITESVRSLERYIDEASAFGKCTTLLVLSSPVEYRSIHKK